MITLAPGDVTLRALAPEEQLRFCTALVVVLGATDDHIPVVAERAHDWDALVAAGLLCWAAPEHLAVTLAGRQALMGLAEHYLFAA